MADQPNIILILMDDMGWKDLACCGSPFYETPNLDRLAAEGMRFTDAYAACPVCSPSRASILTGKFPARLGLTNYIGGTARGKLLEAPTRTFLPLSETSLAAALREGGYSTWHVGKWHLGERPYYPDHHGFDVNVGGCAWGHPQQGYFSPWGIETLADGSKGEYLTDRLTDEAIALVRNAGGKPFYLNLWHYAVHTPIQAPADLVEKYKAKAARLGLDKQTVLVEGEHFPSEHKKHLRVTRRVIQSDPVYAAMVENLDANVGRLMEALETSDKADNTIVVFTSDNGGLSTSEGSPTCNLPLAEGKGWVHDGGTREPLIVRWPSVVAPASVCTTPVTSPDFYPTFLQAAGLPLRPGQHRDGVSLMPLLRGGNQLKRDALFWHYPHYGNQGGTPASAIRMGDWKLIEFHEDHRVALYDLMTDPGEHRDMAGTASERAGKLRTRLHAWLREVGAQLPKPNPDYSP